MEYGIWSLVPAAVTIAVALLTKRVALALFTGVVGGVAVLKFGRWAAFFKALWHYLFEAFTDPERLKIVLFIMLIGGLLKLIARSGAYDKFARSLAQKLNTPRKSRLATMGISLMLFFDDYANVLISGAALRDINARNRVSPAMLAYMVDVIAVMASIMLVSTWASFEGATMRDAAAEIGLPGSMAELFISAMPYHFYTFSAIFLVFLVALTGRWFGRFADTQPFSPGKPQKLHPRVRPAHTLVPILTVILGGFLGLFLLGYIILRHSGQPITLVGMLGAAPSVDVLIGATLLALVILAAMLVRQGILRFASMPGPLLRGAHGMVGVGLVILTATALAGVSADLGTGAFIAGQLAAYIRPEILPVLIYLMAMLITVATGFSWSSMAIVMPIAYPMAVANGVPEFIPVLSAAVITGAVSGEHFIPYSEKCVMTAAATQITPLYHIRTQLPQTLAAFLAGGLAFTLYGYGWGVPAALGAAFALLLLLHVAFARRK